MDDYYVYCYFDGDVPIYVGAGHGKRDTSHLSPSVQKHTHFYNKLRKMQREGREPKIGRLLEGLAFQESRDWERFFIQAIGRRDLGTGPLCNLTDGGEGLANPSNDLRHRMSVAGRKTRAKPEVKQRYSEALKAAFTRPDVKQHHLVVMQNVHTHARK